MVPGEVPKSTQCPSLTSLNTKDVVRRRHKRRSRQHQRFMARKALLQGQELLSMAPGPGLCPLPSPSQMPAGTEASGSRRQRPKARSGSNGLCSKRPVPREAPRSGPIKCVAIDCEMVGTGPQGRILKLLKGKVVVGHALHNDFQALKYVHPRSQTRDTTYVPNLLSQPSSLTRTRVSLKDLALNLLHKKIQVGHQGHSSVEDAMTAMELYQLVELQWEQHMASSAQAHPEDRGPDSSTDVEQYMDDQYWPEDLTQSTRGETRGAQDRQKEGQGARNAPP